MAIFTRLGHLFKSMFVCFLPKVLPLNPVFSFEVKGVPVSVSILKLRPKQMRRWCRRHHQHTGIAICPDTKGSGWALFRLQDDVRVDFCRSDKFRAVSWTKPFLLKTKSFCGPEDLILILREAIRLN